MDSLVAGDSSPAAVAGNRAVGRSSFALRCRPGIAAAGSGLRLGRRAGGTMG